MELDNLDNLVVLEDGKYMLLVDDGGIVFDSKEDWEEFLSDCLFLGIHDTDGVKAFIRHQNVTDGDLKKAMKDYIAELNSYDDDQSLSGDYYNTKKERENTKKLFGKKDINESFDDNNPLLSVRLPKSSAENLPLSVSNYSCNPDIY